MKFRKKPVVIDAVLWNDDGMSSAELARLGLRVVVIALGRLEIETLEGTMIARPGDYVIRGVNGEFYPCKPDIFAATYEPVTPQGGQEEK